MYVAAPKPVIPKRACAGGPPRVPSSSPAVKTRGFGFVEFEDSADAGDAIENMDGALAVPLFHGLVCLPAVSAQSAASSFYSCTIRARV